MAIPQFRIRSLIIVVALAGPIIAALIELGDAGIYAFYALGLCSLPILMATALLANFERLRGGRVAEPEEIARGISKPRIRDFALRSSALNVLLTTSVALWSGDIDIGLVLLAGFGCFATLFILFGMFAAFLLTSPRNCRLADESRDEGGSSLGPTPFSDR